MQAVPKNPHPRTSGALWVYRCLTSVLLLAGVLALPALAVLRRRWLRGLDERLGGVPKLPGGSVWIHAASVGEVRLALPLARRLNAEGERVCVSTTTVAGRDLAARELSEAPCFLAPLDHPWPLRRGLRRIGARLLIVVETELWPEMLAQAGRRGLPTLLINGRISDRTLRRYLRLRPLVSPLLGRMRQVFPRTDADRTRLIQLGCRPEATHPPADLKAVAVAEPQPVPLPPAPPLVLVSGSLHEWELEAWMELVAGTADHTVAHVVAPRHLEWLDRLLHRLGAAGIPHRLWSAHRPVFPQPAPRVLVVDAVGDLAGLYAHGHVAFVGGSLRRGAGGHNLLEPAALGRAVLHGPGVESQKEAARDLAAAGGGFAVRDVAELCRRLREFTEDPDRLREAGMRALGVARATRSSARSAFESVVAEVLQQDPARLG